MSIFARIKHALSNWLDRRSVRSEDIYPHPDAPSVPPKKPPRKTIF